MDRLHAIVVRGARVHNLRGVDVMVPRGQLTVFTGPSGSGKSSLAFDTIYAEAQRRYIESLSVHARQFLEVQARPDVDEVSGLSPALSVEQRPPPRGPRSTVATMTEVYDYLRLLYARIGRPHCWQCGQEMVRHIPSQIAERALAFAEGTRLAVLAPVLRGRTGAFAEELAALRKRGFVRATLDGAQVDLSDDLALDPAKAHELDVWVDRLAVSPSARGRLTEAVESALQLGSGLVKLAPADGEPLFFTDRVLCIPCGVSYPELAPRLFSFNSPHGACPACGGLGGLPTGGGSGDGSGADDRGSLAKEPRPVKPKPRAKKSATSIAAGQSALSEGDTGDDGEPELVLRPCAECEGSRLRRECRYVRVGGRSIIELSRFSIAQAAATLGTLALTAREREIATRILREVGDRLGYLTSAGVGYLELDRPTSTLSGGEAQRIRLATQIGSALTGVLYVLDEPTAGLHPRDAERLLTTLLALRDAGNTVLCVEHDETVIRAADHLVDLGPGAGAAGGRVLAAGSPAELCANAASPTGRFLSGLDGIAVPARRRTSTTHLRLQHATGHNLKDVSVAVPLGTLVCVTGVSGSGKSSLFVDTLYRALAQRTGSAGGNIAPLPFKALRGADAIARAVEVDSAPIGRTPRSNTATYTGIFALLRELFAELPDAKLRGYGPGRFSFNARGGRCEACAGDGVVRIEMHFLPDVFVTCEECGGRRYNRETLEVRYRGLDIAAVLALSVDDARELFAPIPRVRERLDALRDVGLGYLPLGQPATTLSGGEAQRIKLARELGKRGDGPTFYLLDEPTTGLFWSDVRRLLEVLSRLVDAGNTVVLIEHHPDVMKVADHVIELGPEGGPGGGELVAEGPPEVVAQNPRSVTAPYLRRALGLEA